MLAASALAGPPTPILSFTGKGGVGKTSLACATTMQLADAGRRVLLVVTSPEATPVHEAAPLQADGDGPGSRTCCRRASRG